MYRFWFWVNRTRLQKVAEELDSLVRQHHEANVEMADQLKGRVVGKIMQIVALMHLKLPSPYAIGRLCIHQMVDSQEMRSYRGRRLHSTLWLGLLLYLALSPPTFYLGVWIVMISGAFLVGWTVAHHRTLYLWAFSNLYNKNTGWAIKMSLSQYLRDRYLPERFDVLTTQVMGMSQELSFKVMEISINPQNPKLYVLLVGVDGVTKWLWLGAWFGEIEGRKQLQRRIKLVQQGGG